MIKYHSDVIQGSDEWHALRCGILTASEMKLIVTPTLKTASNDKERAHLYELLAQRITHYVEPRYISDDMLRGKDDEIEARIHYEKHYEPVTDCGFITNDKFGFVIGYSPDGLVGDDGLIECKSRRQKYQIQTLCEYATEDTICPDYIIQVQTGLLVSERNWCDLISYCGGLPMVTVRVFPSPAIQEAIVKASTEFETRLRYFRNVYDGLQKRGVRMIETERKITEEMI